MKSNYGNIFAKTKILATLGPSTCTKEMIKNLMEAGVDGVRLNFSHGDYNFYEKLCNEINEACIEESEPLAVLLDLQGPKIRIGQLAEESFEIESGKTLEISVEDILGTKEKVSTSYKFLVKDAKIGDPILIDDGLLKLRVIKKTEKSVICEIENGGILKPKKGMNLPGMQLSTPSVTEKDLHDVEFAINHRVDFIALSFVRMKEDIFHLRHFINEKGKNIPIIAKIELKEGVDNFESILKASDGIMVARGDLGVELATHEVPIVQKQIIRRCNEVGKLVITATQMLESMIHNPVPTRAEASDVANAVWDGTDVVMLSGETSVGKYPIKTVEMMNNIIRNAEKNLDIVRKINFEIPESIEENLFDSVNKAICSISEQINASAIVVFTHTGRSARSISKFHPKARIIAISDNFDTMNNLCLKWGVSSIFRADFNKEETSVDYAKKLIVEANHVISGDVVIFSAGSPQSDKSRMNWMKFEMI